MRFITLILMIVSHVGFGHGENKVGPHGGFIRMPGAFHTEVVETEKAFHVYLLDIEWKNPTTKNSSVALELERGGKRIALPCAKKREFFACIKPNEPLKDLSGVVVKSTRDGQTGAPMPYEYPLMTISSHSKH